MNRLEDYHCIGSKKTLLYKFSWTCIYLAFIGGTIFLILTLSEEFINNPTVTSLESSYYEVSKVDFPGVGICNINKISKKRAELLATKMAEDTGKTVEAMVDILKTVGKLYDFDFDNKADILLKYQIILDDLDLDIYSLTKQLATPCQELLHHCRWANKEINCSKIFRLRRSSQGYCCMFNYVKTATDMNTDFITSIVAHTTYGIEWGLSVVINNELEDYLYTSISSIGALVQIFVPTDYPDIASGSLVENLASPNSENFLSIMPTTVRSVREVANYPINKRECLFDSERPTDFYGVYSQSDCNVDCRVKSALALCRCVPFMIPVPNNDSVCTLVDLPCISRYKNKWSSLSPGHDSDPALSREQQDALRCSDICYPSCGGTLYDVSAISVPIYSPRLQAANATVVHVYYPKRFSSVYKQDVVFYWFEILSNYGGIFGLLIGFSFISIIEIVIYSLYAFFRKLFS